MMEQRFAYHRSVAPMMWVFVGLASIELMVVHLLLTLWNPTAALVLSVVSLAGIVWLVSVIVAMKRLPIVLDDHRLVMRVGTLKQVTVDRDRIAGMRPSWDAATLKQRSVLNLALIAYPNVVIELTAPLPGRTGIAAIAHRVDDPVAFARAIDALGAAS